VADFEEKRPYLLEDVDQHPIDESTLFHLINAVRQNGKTLLLTARSWPASWNIQLPDLVSRLRAITLVELFEPDDELLTGVIYKLIADRQMKVEEPTIRYLVTHMERSLGSANAFIAELDRRALAEKRAITRPFAASLLAEYQQPDFLVDD
jgi:chromosomal replication initiation ATPase DnaA